MRTRSLWPALFLAAGVTLIAIVGFAPSQAEEQKADDLAARLRTLDTNVYPTGSDKAKQLAQMLSADIRGRRDAVNLRETQLWNAINSREAWEAYRDPRLKALRASLGQFPEPPKDLKTRVTKTIDGEGYRIENVTFESRPGLVVTANVYSPAKPQAKMPGIIVCHSHHNPKTQGELQDMGILWAKAGCTVIVLDQLGHGERRQHPFRETKDYPGTFRLTRQDYYFRYNSAAHLHLIGDSLVGWMAWDMSRSVDLLLAQPGIDKDKIILLGSVAGGGDPTGVTAAIDPRIAAVAPFNFGGPQPETTFPLPDDAERSFNYVGGGSWESTRNLRLSARDGFLPWVIVGGVAPRRVIHAHEFAWDRERDPVWKRYEKIFSFYEAKDHLAAAHGRGKLSGQPPESTHCNNIGAEHRKGGIYAALERWFKIPVPEKENMQRHTADELLCLKADEPKPRLAHSVAGEIADQRMAAARKKVADAAANQRRIVLRDEWQKLLGEIQTIKAPQALERRKEKVGDIVVEHLAVQVERDVIVPTLVLVPDRKGAGPKLPVVVCVCQEGKRRFLKERSEAIARLLEGKVAVCLLDLPGCGETAPGNDRGRTSSATSLSASELMLGGTMLGMRLKAMFAVFSALGSHEDLDWGTVALWGDSFAPVNPADARMEVPWDAEKLPAQSEPLGGNLALLSALFSENVRVVYARGGLVGYRSLLDSPFLYTPHDMVVPGALTAGDLCDIVPLIAYRPIRLEGLVDGLNRRVSDNTLKEVYAAGLAASRAQKPPDRFQLREKPADDKEVAEWLLTQLGKR